MAGYVLHVEASTPDGSDEDPGEWLHSLVAGLADAGHVVYAASITVGTARDLIKHHDGELHYEHRPQ